MNSFNFRQPLKLALVAVLASTLAACQLLEGVLPTSAPPADQERPGATTEPADESPRIRSSTEVPPTWTPPIDRGVTSETPVSSGEITPGAVDQASYVVQPGDTLAEIALRFNVTVEALAQANDIDDLDHIEAGQVLVIPGF